MMKRCIYASNLKAFGLHRAIFLSPIFTLKPNVSFDLPSFHNSQLGCASMKSHGRWLQQRRRQRENSDMLQMRQGTDTEFIVRPKKKPCAVIRTRVVHERISIDTWLQYILQMTAAFTYTGKEKEKQSKKHCLNSEPLNFR